MSTVQDHPSVQVRPEEAPPGDRFVGIALILLAVVFLGYQVLAREVVVPLVVQAVIFGGLGVVVARWRRRWLLVLVAVLATVGLVGSLPFVLDNIVHPESSLSFLVEAFSVLAGLAVIGGAVVGLRTGSRPGTRRPVALVVGVLAVVAVVVTLVASRGVESDPAQSGDTTIEVARFHFPDHVAVSAGQAGLWIDNQDPVRHTLVIDGTDIHVELPASTAVRAEIDLAPGTYRYFCDVPGHEQMEGELGVR